MTGSDMEPVPSAREMKVLQASAWVVSRTEHNGQVPGAAPRRP